MTAPKLTALVLAADRGAEDPVARHAGVVSKSLVPVAGTAMLERVVSTLGDSKWIGRIAVLHNLADIPPALEANTRLSFIGARATPSRSVLHAIEALDDPLPLLIATADNPLLTVEMLEYFCARSFGTGADICAGVTAASLIRARWPQARRTYLRFRGESFSGANLFAVMTDGGVKAVEFWSRVEAYRKRPWRIAAAFGIRLLAGYVLKRWTLDEAVAQASARLGLRAAAIEMPFAEAAIDVDKPDDLALVEEILGAAR